MKKQIAEDMITFCAPFRERILELENDNEYLQKVLKEGAEQARESASQTLKEVREIIGFRAF
jgi:tryptophanyl-tRNA synthetase